MNFCAKTTLTVGVNGYDGIYLISPTFENGHRVFDGFRDFQQHSPLSDTTHGGVQDQISPLSFDPKWRISQQPQPDRYIIAAGSTHHLTELVELKLQGCNQHWVDFDSSLMWPTDHKEGRADAGEVHRELGWRTTYRLDDIVRCMTMVERELLPSART